VKGFTSQQKKSSQEYTTIQPIGGGKYGLDTIQRAYFELGADTVEADSTDVIMKATTHNLRVGDAIRFSAGTTYEFLEVSIIEVIDADHFRIGHRLDSVPITGEGFITLRAISQKLNSSGSFTVTAALVTFVDELDAETLDPSSTTIPKSSSNAIAIVASLAAPVSEIQVIQDVGEFMAIYTDAARTSKICNLPLTPDEKVSVTIPVGTAIYIGAIKDVDITAASLLLINFIG